MSAVDVHSFQGHKHQAGSLHLTGRSLNTLPDLQQAQEVYAAANRISSLDDLGCANGLLLADLSWNSIEQVPQGLPPTLISLNLGHNKLVDLPSTLSALALLPKLRILQLKGNPFCLQPCYLSAVQQALPLLQHFDGTKTWLKPPASASADNAATNSSSPAAGDGPLLADGTQQHLHICFSQLSVQNTSPGRLPASQAASESVPLAYLYYLQLRTAEGGLVCSFPAVLTPQDELIQWQAQQSAAPAATGKKANSKTGTTGKGSKADAAEQRKTWYQEGSLTAALPASADVDTQGWLQSGMTVQLLQVCTLPVTPAGGTAGLVACEGSTKSSERCIARGVLQPDALLEGVTREWSSRLSLLKEPPLFDAQGIRLGVHLGATGNDEEQPAFLLVTDLASVSKEGILDSELGLIRQVMQACIMYSLSVRLPIAFMAELRIQQDMAFGFKLTEVRGVRDIAGCREAARHVGQSLLQHTSSTEASADDRPADGSLELPLQRPSTVPWQAERQTGVLHHFGWVSSAGVASCAQLLKSSSPSTHISSKLDSHASKGHRMLLFCQAWCLHEAAKLLPLQARCLDLVQLERHTLATSDAGMTTGASPTPGYDQQAAGNHASILDSLKTFIHDWCASFQEKFLEATAAGELEAADQVRLLDAVDGRLWHFMTCCLLAAAPVGLPARAVQTAEQLMQAVCQLAGIADDSITMGPVMHSHISSDGQSQQAGAEDPGTPTSGSPVCTHTVHGNAFVDAFLGPPAASGGVDGKVAGDDRLALFNEAYHWHTGRPLEPTYLGETGEDRIMAVWKNATLLQMIRCPMLPFFRRKQLKQIHSMCMDIKLLPRAEQRQERLKSALKAAHGWLEANLRRLEQRHATFMRNYANSMMSTAYQGPAAVVAPAKRKGPNSSNSSSNSSSSSSRNSAKDPKPGKLSKADLIRQQQSEKRAAEDAAKLTERWKAKQQELERAVQASGWTSRLQSEVEKFLSECKHGTPPAYLLASVFLLEQCLNAWKEACLGRRRRASSAAAGAASTGPAAKAASAATSGSVAGGVSHAVTVWLTVQELVRRGVLDPTNSTAASDKDLAKKAGKLCEHAMQLLGFLQAAAHIDSLLATSRNAKLPKKHKQTDQKPSEGATAVGAATCGGQAAASSGSSQKAFAAGMTEAEFQLQHCGNLLQRDVPAVRDPRVISFNPDLWQRAVLDAIDVDSSAVVCAPTSSGKTFISSYCMDRVLRQSKEGTVVFVAPTKALVNQTAAQVLKDFSNYKGSSDKSVYGVFTRDFRINALEARILVTVPACLEILLFSPAHRDWVSRLRYVIFDEVHCMREGGVKEGGAAENTGTIWEHCLLLIRCPFLALSATIGNPEQVTGWLQSVKALQQEQDTKLGIAGPDATYRVGLIQHTERYADLRYYTFRPGASQKEDDCANISDCTGAAFNKIHPCSVLTPEQLQHNGFPSEVSLEPCDCLELFHAMRDALQAGSEELRQALSTSEAGTCTAATQTPATQQLAPSTVPGSTLPGPAKASSTAVCDTHAESGPWRAAAQAALNMLSPDVYFLGGKPISRSAVRVWEKLLKERLVHWAAGQGAVGLHAAAQVLAQLKERSAWDPSTTFTKESYDPVQFYSMLRALDQQDKLPALTFSFERRKCERLAEGVVQLLESGEARRKAASGNELQRQQAAAERAHKAVKASRDKKLGRKAAEDALQEDTSGLADEEEDSIDPDFSFAGRVRVLSPQELRELIELATRGMEDGDPLKRALLRGIGVHHSGLPTKYRQVVEILFRCHYLRVVLATGTLAYGINMPCRTVVFAGDHIFLNSLQFRQMTGRAGRRGFDTLGHVVFWAVPSRKCTSLLVSPVPRLHGNFPMSVSLSLRLLTLHSAAPEDAQLQNDLLRLLQRPFYACEDLQLQQKMQHLFQFSLQYLQLQDALNAQGRPVQLAGMAMHLFWTEPANFAFVTLLRKGVFHRICDGVKATADAPLSDNVADEMLLVLSHVFERVQLAPFVRADQESIHTSPSKVILEPLSSEVDSLLAAHNQEAVDNLVAYISAYISSNAAALPASNVMPLSGFTYPPPAACASVSQQQPLLEAGMSSDRVQAGGASRPGGHDSGALQVSGALQAYRKKHQVSSPFISLSGYDEEFSSTQQLVQCVRPGILLDAASVPSVQMTNRNGQVLPLNRYILDYWGHGQKQALVHANGLREGDAWEHLRTFVGILQAIATAMQKMVKGTAAESDPVVHSFGKLSESFGAKHKAFNSAMQLQRG